MIGFVFSENFPWGRSTQQTVSKLVSVVQLQVPSLLSGYREFLIIFWFVVAIIGFAMGDVAFVSNMFKKNEFSHMWPVKFLRFFVSLLATVFFIPFFNVLLKPLDCHYNTVPPGLDSYPDIACWDPVNAFHSAVAIIAAISFSVFSLVVVLVFVDPDPTANQPLSTPHSFFDLNLLISRIILSLSSTFLSQHVGWLAAINFLVHAVSFCAIVYMCPYFMLVATRIRSGFFAVLAFSSAVLVGVVQHSSSDSEIPSLVFLCGVIPVFCLGYWLPLWRLQRLCKHAVASVSNQPDFRPSALSPSLGALSFPGQHSSLSLAVTFAKAGSEMLRSNTQQQLSQQDMPQSPLPGASQHAKEPLVFRTIFEVELATRFLQHDTSQQCLDTASKIFERGMIMFPNSPLLILMYASFAQFNSKNLQLAQTLVSKANSMRPYFGFRFLVYRKTREMFTKGEIDMISAVDFKRHYAGAHKYHLVCVKAMIRLWRQLLPNKVNVINLPEILEKIYQSEERAEIHFKHMMRKYKNPRVLRAYGSFLADCKNNQSLGLRYFAAAEDMEDQGELQGEKNAEEPTFQSSKPGDPSLMMSTSFEIQSSPVFEIFNPASPVFAALPVILLSPFGEIISMSHAAADLLSTSPHSNLYERFSDKFLSGQSKTMFNTMMDHASQYETESGIPTHISEGFLIALRKIPIYYKLFKLVSPIFESDRGEHALALVFDKGLVGAKRGRAVISKDTMTIKEADDSFASLCGHDRPSTMIGTEAMPLLRNIGCNDLEHTPQLVYTQDHNHHHLWWYIMDITKHSGKPNKGSGGDQLPQPPSFHLTLHSVSLPPDSTLNHVDLYSGEAHHRSAMQQAQNEDAEDVASDVVGAEVTSPASQAPPGLSSKDARMTSMIKKRGKAGSVTSTELSASFGGSSAIKAVLDDGLDVKKKSTVAIFHRNIRIGIFVMALFAIGCYVTIMVLAGQTEQTLKNERDAGKLSTMAERMVAQTRTIDVYPLVLKTIKDVTDTQIYLGSMAKEFHDMFHHVYYLGDQLKFKPLHDLYYTPSVILYELGGPHKNATETLSSVWDAERLFAYHCKIISGMSIRDLGIVNGSRTRVGNSSMFFTNTNGPYSIKDALATLAHMYRDFSLNALEQIVAIESTVLGSSIAVLLGLVVVVQLSLRLVHKDKVRSIDLFLMIPKQVIQGLLNRKYMILEEMNELRDPSELPPLWMGTPSQGPEKSTQDVSDLKHHQGAEMPPHPLPPVPPAVAAVRFTSISPLPSSFNLTEQSKHQPSGLHPDHTSPQLLHHTSSQHPHHPQESLSSGATATDEHQLLDKLPPPKLEDHVARFHHTHTTLLHRDSSSMDGLEYFDSSTPASMPAPSPALHSGRAMPVMPLDEPEPPTEAKATKSIVGVLFSRLRGRLDDDSSDDEEQELEPHDKKPTKGEHRHRHRHHDEHQQVSRQKVSKKFEQALASPAVKVFTRKYGFVTAIIAALLITSFVITLQAISQTSIIAREIDLSSSRNYLTIHIRNLALEMVLTKSTSIAAYIKVQIKVLLKIHSALLHGDPDYGVTGSALRYQPQEDMLYGEGCFREDPTLCPPITHPYFIQLNAGLATLMRDYLQVFMRFVDSDPQDWSFSNPDFPFVYDVTVVIKSIRDGLQILTDLYLQEAKILLQHSVDIQLYITLSILFLLFVLYIVVFRPMIRFIRDETRRTCAMLLMLPADLVSAMPEIRDFITDKQAELKETRSHQ